jgi:hypothetical protein
MENSERTVFNYRAWKPFIRALGWVVFGPLCAAILVDGFLKPQHSASAVTAVIWWLYWLMPIFIACEVLAKLIFLFNFVNERVVIEGTRLSYFNWIGKRKISVDLSEIKEIDALAGPTWKVFTPQGRFVFTRQLRNYEALLLRLREAGTAINPIPRL